MNGAYRSLPRLASNNSSQRSLPPFHELQPLTTVLPSDSKWSLSFYVHHIQLQLFIMHSITNLLISCFIIFIFALPCFAGAQDTGPTTAKPIALLEPTEYDRAMPYPKISCSSLVHLAKTSPHWQQLSFHRPRIFVRPSQLSRMHPPTRILLPLASTWQSVRGAMPPLLKPMSTARQCTLPLPPQPLPQTKPQPQPHRWHCPSQPIRNEPMWRHVSAIEPTGRMSRYPLSVKFLYVIQHLISMTQKSTPVSWCSRSSSGTWNRKNFWSKLLERP